MNDPRTVRRLATAEIFRAYDGGLEGVVKVSHFCFIFKDLVDEKHISSKLFLRDVVGKLDVDSNGSITLNDFIAWIEGVR